MHHTPTNLHAFLQELDTLGEIFSDPLSEGRQALYWQDLAPQITIEEWRAACALARTRETFPKVPLPARLLEYVQEVRTAQRDHRQREARADGSHTDAHLLQLREPLMGHEEVRRLIAQIWPDHAMPTRERVPRAERHLSPEELHYTPQVDGDARKALLRAQAQQVQDETATRARLEEIQREVEAALAALDARDHARANGQAVLDRSLS